MGMKRKGHYRDKDAKRAFEEIISKKFYNEQCNELQFDMNTFYGQCHFWYYILEKFNVINKLFTIQYLKKCTKGHDSYSIWSKDYDYRRIVRFLASDIIHTEHLFYILDEIDITADAQ